MHRRAFLLATSAITLVAAQPFLAGAALSQPADLLNPPPIPEQILGNPNAPVTIIEYASLTCHYCESFHKETWPTLKSKYVDTGKVRFILREFPSDPLGMAGFVLARCSGPKWYGVVDLLFQTADNWAHSKTPAEALLQTMRQTGMSKERFDACLREKKIEDDILQVRERAAKVFGVNSTPTFFINDTKYVGNMPMQKWESILDPLLKEAKK